MKELSFLVNVNGFPVQVQDKEPKPKKKRESKNTPLDEAQSWHKEQDAINSALSGQTKRKSPFANCGKFLINSNNNEED